MAKSTKSNKSLPEQLRTFYAAITTEGAAALTQLPELYSADVDFANPVVHEKGLPAFEKLWHKSFRMYKTFEFHDLEVTGNDEYFSMAYTMAVGFGVGPIFKSNMSTSFWARDGKVYLTRDYFDPLGSLLAPFPVMTWVYHKVFGVLVA